MTQMSLLYAAWRGRWTEKEFVGCVWMWLRWVILGWALVEVNSCLVDAILSAKAGGFWCVGSEKSRRMLLGLEVVRGINVRESCPGVCASGDG